MAAPKPAPTIEEHRSSLLTEGETTEVLDMLNARNKTKKRSLSVRGVASRGYGVVVPACLAD